MFQRALLLFVVIATVTANDALIQWLRANGGEFSEKVQYEHLDPNDKTSPVGLFAKEALTKGETVMVIPQKCLLKAKATEDMCATARELAMHVRLGEKSFFKDYVNYLFDGNKHKKLPRRWSREAKEIMNEIAGDELQNPLDAGPNFRARCGSGGGELEEDAWESLIARGWTEIMIPLYDMINHRVSWVLEAYSITLVFLSTHFRLTNSARQNGHWRNVDSTSAHIGEPIRAYAIRDIKAGEQIYMSYNECDDTDCEGIFYTYGTIEILTDYGFVDEFPQRWIFEDIPGLDEDSDPLMIEVDRFEKPDLYDPDVMTMQYEVTWQTEERPDLDTLNFLNSQVNRLESLEGDIFAATESLQSGHEQYTIRKYHHDLKMALKLAIWASYEEAVDNLEVSEDEKDDAGHNYDTLEKRTRIGDVEDLSPRICHGKHDQSTAKYFEPHFETHSQYQKIQYRHGEDYDDTCLHLGKWLQTCTSFRIYHEALIHYPASFLPELKRVVYIGGGDNMILHELLKYQSIELVVGFELDQRVVRTAFMNFGTLPYFDDPRVQWWFGDAAKSLRMIPTEYLGSFDLVLLDMQFDLVESLFVTDTLTIMDIARLLVKESAGIISKNDDHPVREVTSLGRYTVAMEYSDIPQLCRQTLSMGSDSIDFFRAPQYSHDIHRLWLNATLQESGKFKHWYDFRDSLAGSKEAAVAKAPDRINSSGKAIGVLIAIEVEELDGTIKDEEGCITAIKDTLTTEGFEVLSVDKRQGSFAFVLGFSEGYVVVRKFQNVDNYMAVDLVLWASIEKSNSLKSRILSSLGGNSDKSSSFRLVMGGIEGENSNSLVSGEVRQEGSCTNPDATVAPVGMATDAEVWSELSTLIPSSTGSSVVVLCGSEDVPCPVYDLLKADTNDAIVPIYTCKDFDASDEKTFFNCEAAIMKSLRSRGVKTLSGIMLDGGATQSMARVFLRLIAGFVARSNGILNETNYVVVAEVNGDPWRAIFVERFRTEISPFAPASEARLLFGSEREFAFYASGISDIYAYLANFELNHKATVKYITTGHAAYIPDFDPFFFNNTHYDNSRAYSQWNSQEAVGTQALFQLELRRPLVTLKQGDEVLWQHVIASSPGDWIPAIVIGANDDSTYDISTTERGSKREIPRDFLRSRNFDVSETSSSVGARVLVRTEKDLWQEAIVLSQSEDGKYCQVRTTTAESQTIEKDIRHLIPRMEAIDEEVELPEISLATLGEALKSSLATALVGDTLVDMALQQHSIREGGIITAFWDDGNAVLIWNGDKHIDINFFSRQRNEEMVDEFHDHFLEKFPFMVTVTKDVQPRGYGGVIFFDDETEDKTPIWWYGNDDEA